MNASYFKKSFVSFLTLTALMGASQNLLAMDTYEDDKGNPQPLQRIQNPDQSESTAPKPMLLASMPRDLVAAHVIPYIDAAAGVWFEHLYLKLKGGKLPNCKGAIDARTQLCSGTLKAFRAVPLCELTEANRLATLIRTSSLFKLAACDKKTGEEVIDLALGLYKKTKGPEQFYELCNTLCNLKKDREAICSEVNRLVTRKVERYDLSKVIKHMAKLGNNRASFLAEFSPFITKHIKVYGRCDYIKSLGYKADTMIPTMRLANKYGLFTIDMHLAYAEDFLDLIASFGDEGESVCASVQPFSREGMHPIPVINFIKAVHGLGKDRNTALEELKTLLGEESTAENVLEIADILGTDFEKVLTYARTNGYVSASMPFYKIRNYLRNLKLLGDQQEPVCSAVNELVTEGEDRSKTIQHLHDSKYIDADLNEALELIKRSGVININYGYDKSVLIRHIVGLIRGIRKEDRQEVCTKALEQITKCKEIIYSNKLEEVFKEYMR